MEKEFLEHFKECLSKEKPELLVQEYLFDKSPYFFEKNPELLIDFREEICKTFSVHPQNFSIIGSSKLGFSLNPRKLFEPFSDISDIDVVLISEELFQDLWITLIECKEKTPYKLDPWYSQNFTELRNFLFNGMIRVDKLSERFDFAKTWWEFFNKLSKDSRFGPRRIRGAIFKSWKHASYYYIDSIKKARDQSESNSH